MDHQTWLLLVALVAVLLLVALIAWLKVNSFVSLTLVSLVAGVVAGMPAPAVADAFQHGAGEILGSTALIIGLGAILGEMLAESGGAGELAKAIVARCGPAGLPLALALGAFFIGLPMFFTVGLVLLVPVADNLSRQTGSRLYRLGLPLVAGLSASHGLTPPHPGPLIAAGVLKADVGLTLGLSLLVGAPTTILCAWAIGRIRLADGPAPPDETMSPALAPSSHEASASAVPPASAWTAVAMILLPVVLMLQAAVVKPTSPVAAQASAFLGHPAVALLIGVLAAFVVLGTWRGKTATEILDVCRRSLLPVGEILLIVAAGGGLSKVLIAAGAGDAIATRAQTLPLSPLILAWLLAAAVRVATGSATVAVSTAAGLVAPLVAASSAIRPELFVLALGAGSLVLSHVNDGGFWLVQKYLRLTVPETLRTWTILETMISLVSLALVLALSATPLGRV